MTYQETMEWGARQYDDVLRELSDAGLPAEFTQTGGMNAALCVTLEDGSYVLLTDQDDTLSWERPQHEGWFVGLYEPEERRTVDGPIRWLSDSEGSPSKAIELVFRVLRGESKRLSPED
jgi:hypothetical protein